MSTFTKLDDFLPYLVQRIGNQIDEAVAAEAKKAGLTVEMVRVLVIIYQLGPQNLTDLSKHTGINTSTLSRLIGRMEEKELVSREAASTGRSVKIDLLSLGKEKLLVLLPLTDNIKGLVSSHFSAEEYDQVKKTLNMLYELFEKLPEQQDNPSSSKKKS